MPSSVRRTSSYGISRAHPALYLNLHLLRTLLSHRRLLIDLQTGIASEACDDETKSCPSPRSSGNAHHLATLKDLITPHTRLSVHLASNLPLLPPSVLVHPLLINVQASRPQSSIVLPHPTGSIAPVVARPNSGMKSMQWMAEAISQGLPTYLIQPE